MKSAKRLLCVMLALCLTVMWIPVSASAASPLYAKAEKGGTSAVGSITVGAGSTDRF